MFETQKVSRHDKLRKGWSQHKSKCKSQMGQDQVSGGLSVLCWHAAPVAMFYGNLPNFGKKVQIRYKVQFGNKLTNRCNVWSIESVNVYGHVPECHETFGRGWLQRFFTALLRLVTR